MKFLMVVVSLLFIYAGVSNFRRGDLSVGTSQPRHIPVPRRALGFMELFIGLLLGGVILSILTAKKL
jgi:hypothetical protein